ncbi:MAG TPA: DNA repair protein RecO [Thermoanaerobaculia bacterium]|nr:DNA repair protein RecO [Thermoanaerobaculia bacterium]
MRLFNAEALLLDVRDLHERDRIVTFLTREQGKKKGVARGARGRFSRFAGQLQPLAKVQVSWFEKEGRDLMRVTAVELVRPAHRLQADLEGILLGSYLADHVLEFAQENESSDLLFRLLDSTLEALLAGVDRDLAARYFEAWVLRLAGIFPAPHACPLCGAPLAGGAVLPRGGETLLCFRCGAAGGGGELAVGAETIAFLCLIGRLSLPKVAVAPTPPPSQAAPAAQAPPLRQVEELCARVRRHFLQRELRSYEVIQKTRAAL